GTWTRCTSNGWRQRMSEARFTVPGKPVPAVRMTRKSMFTNPKAQRYLAYKDTVGWAAKEAVREPIDGPVGVDIEIYLKDRFKRRWDIDNVAKAILDGCNAICYHDDKQVASLEVRVYTAARHPLLDDDPTERV